VNGLRKDNEVNMGSYRQKLIPLLLVAILLVGASLSVAAVFAGGEGRDHRSGDDFRASGNDDDDEDEKPRLKSDSSLFTTQDTGPSADNFVTCNATRAAELHITATNFDLDENRINIVFADGDSILIRVPSGQSFSLTQVIGTTKGVDDVIKIDPLDQDGDVNPMVGWVSIHRVEGGARVSCTVATFNPIP